MKITKVIVMLLLVGGFINIVNANNEEDVFKIVFWSSSKYSVEHDNIMELNSVTYDIVSNKNTLDFIITINDIEKYFWKEQYILVNWYNVFNDPNFIASEGFFSIVLNNEVIYSGLNRIFENAYIFPEDKVGLPVIQIIEVDEVYSILYIRSNYLDSKPINSYLKEDKDKLFNKSIYSYFDSIGKIELRPFNECDISDQIIAP